MQTLILMALMLSSMSAQAKSFAQCVDAANILHRYEREDGLLQCFQQHKALLGSDTCYSEISKLKAAQGSVTLSEKLKSICFYDASIFQNAQVCVHRASEFQYAENHDEALFDCFNQFQDKISQKTCLEISSKIIYPSKKDHLRQHCIDSLN